MMKGLLFTLAILGAAIADTKVVEETLRDFWKAAHDGDAVKYHSFFASNVQILTNGELDEAPWGDVNFVKNLFTKVRYVRADIATPLAAGPDNTFFATFDWDVIILSTGEFINMGPWSQQIAFDSAGKISKIASVCNAVVLDQLSAALNEPKPAKRDLLQNFIDAWSRADVDRMLQFINQGFVISKNGMDDPRWTDAKFLQSMFANAFWKVEIADFATASINSALANLSVTVTSKNSGKSASYLDGWFVQFALGAETEEPTVLASVTAVGDTLAFYEANVLAYPEIALQANM